MSKFHATDLQDEYRAVSVDLAGMTDARVSLGRFGSGAPTKALLAFQLDHARAREAVWSAVDEDKLTGEIEALGLDVIRVESMAQDRSKYLRRPDLGRRLSSASAERLAAMSQRSKGCDVVITIADGLSSSAVDINAAVLITGLVVLLRERGLTLGPLVIARQARVALTDEVGEILGATITIALIGERPGLSAADSLGAYITYGPRVGTADSRRNCVSNMREGGLSMDQAANTIARLVFGMVNTGVSGVGLKEALVGFASGPEGAVK
ncbi:ethanolamine ammonia-lyase subunit EutC [Neorhizobium galegae]|uniref:ethanolamine ammonia-lyase subunit EutC n=1 Tax=Neorhizobium galegae TaxID=399 RepID=UPI002103B9B6|nr:ethanolamine ammonia-lyase subunit EutC [Neorhizobium galegae]MCQ1767827.1 ethanolamine ammonia-lyase subunit EutC [Neorhizobium galegae]MCQ1848166.1 ethanolamine ammonia-lyase subunit EutC [Neorhizobium galegae]